MFDQGTLDEVIRRIVEVEDPEKIILFGCAARGDMNAHSDLDLLIVNEGGDALDLMARIYRKLHGVAAAVNAIVVAPWDVARYKNSHTLVIKPASQERRVVYETS